MNCNFLTERARATRGQHLVTHFEPTDLVANRFHHTGALAARDKRHIGLHLILSLNHQYVRKVKTRCFHINQHIVLAYGRFFPVSHQLQLFWQAMFLAYHCFHRFSSGDCLLSLSLKQERRP